MEVSNYFNKQICIRAVPISLPEISISITVYETIRLIRVAVKLRQTKLDVSVGPYICKQSWSWKWKSYWDLLTDNWINNSLYEIWLKSYMKQNYFDEENPSGILSDFGALLELEYVCSHSVVEVGTLNHLNNV